MHLEPGRHRHRENRIARRLVPACTVVSHGERHPAILVCRILLVDVGPRFHQLVGQGHVCYPVRVGHLGGNHHLLALGRLRGIMLDLPDVGRGIKRVYRVGSPRGGHPNRRVARGRSPDLAIKGEIAA